MAPLIKVRLPPSSSSDSQLGNTIPSSISAPSTSKRDQPRLDTSTPSNIPSTPKRQVTTIPHTPSRRNNKRNNTSFNKPPTSAPNSPSPVRKLKGRNPRSKKTSLLASSSSSSLDPSSPSKPTFISTVEKGRSRNASNGKVIVPWNDKSKQNTVGKTSKEQIKKNELLNYEDPLLSTSTTITSTPNKTISLSNSSNVPRMLETSKKPPSSTTLIVQLGESKGGEEVQKEDGKPVGSDGGGCDDSGCDIDWEDSFYSARNRTCSNSSTFTSITTSSFTSSNETSAIEDFTLLFNHFNDNGNDFMFTPTTDSFAHHFSLDNQDGNAQDASRMRTNSSPTISPASSRSSFCLSYPHHSSSSPLEGSFEKDVLLSEKFPCFHVSDNLAREVSSLRLRDASGLVKQEEEENEDDFPLSMLEKNIRGLIDEPATTATTASFSIFPTPPLRDSMAKKEIVQPITVYSRQRLQGFSGKSPLPQTPSNTFVNALESFENRLELSKKVSYPFSLSSAPSLANLKSMDTLTNNAKGIFTPGNGNGDKMNLERKRLTVDLEFPACRCGCGEQQQVEEDFNLTPSTPSFGLKEGRNFAISPFSIEVAQKEHPHTILESGSEKQNKNAQHKSIWSISSPPISPIKESKLQKQRSTSSLGFSFNDEFDDPLKIEYGLHNSATTYDPSDEYHNSYHHQLQSSVFGIVPASFSFSGYGSMKSTLKRAVSSHLPMNGNDDHSRSFEYTNFGPQSPYPYAHHHHHSNFYSAPPRHAHSHAHYSNQQQYNNHYYNQQQRLVNYQLQPQGPSPNNKKGELYKTELCKSWSEIGNCRYGEKCQFAHGLIELRSMNIHNNNHHFSNDRYQYHQREHSISLSPYGSSSSVNNHYKVPFSPSPLNSEYKNNQFGINDYPEDDIIGHKRMMEIEGLKPLIETRRRSVSSPSKIRMYGLNKSATSMGKEHQYSVWNDHDIFNIGKDKTYPSINDNDNDDAIFGHFSPFPRELKADKKLLPTEKSLSAALKAEAADAPVPTFNIGPQ